MRNSAQLMEYLTQTHGISQTIIDDVYGYAKDNYEIGNYDECFEWYVFPGPNLIFRFKMTSLRISGLENSFNWHHQTTSMLWMQFGVVWLLQSVLNNLMLLMKQWPNWEKILIRLVKFFSKIEILTRVLFEIRTTEAICQNVHEILHLRLKFKRNSYISLTGAISMIWFIFQLDVMDLQAPFNCSNNELGCCIGPFSSFSMDWHVVKSF